MSNNFTLLNINYILSNLKISKEIFKPQKSLIFDV